MSPTTSNSESNPQSPIAGVVSGLLAIGVIIAVGVASVTVVVVVVKRKQGRRKLNFEKGCSMLKYRSVCIRLLYYGYETMVAIHAWCIYINSGLYCFYSSCFGWLHVVPVHFLMWCNTMYITWQAGQTNSATHFQ